MSNSAKNKANRNGYTIEVSTAEECRNEIVSWLRQAATRLSSQARLARLKKVQFALKIQAESYDDVANFINRIEIVKPNPIAIHKVNRSVDDWIKIGYLIEAIKKHRIDTGVDLLTAKNFVDARRRELGLTS